MLAMVMQILDMTIANVALPSMQNSLGAAQDTISWVLTSYIVASAIATPLTAWLAERFGRRQLFLATVAGFVAASALCGAAQSLEEMVLFRVLQGAFGAALVPLSQATLFDLNPPERRGGAMALWGAGVMVGPILGPTLGGWLTEVASWRWAFYVNLPVGILAFLGMFLYLPDTKRRARPFDLFGFAWLSIALGAAQLLLDRGRQLDWFSSPEILIEAGIAASALWIFLVHSLSAKEPFIDLEVFRDRNFVSALLFIFLISTTLFATMALLPPMMQQLYGYSTISVGLLLAPRGFGTMAAMVVVGRLMNKIDARLLMLFGSICVAISVWQMTAFAPVMTEMPFITTGIIQGFGFGFVFMPLNMLAFATLPAQLRTLGASVFSLVRNIGSAIGISIMVSTLANSIQVNHAELGERLTPFRQMPATSPIAEAALAAGDPRLLTQLNGLVSQQSAFIAYLDDFKLMMIVTLCAIPLVFLLRRSAVARSAVAAAHMD